MLLVIGQTGHWASGIGHWPAQGIGQRGPRRPAQGIGQLKLSSFFLLPFPPSRPSRLRGSIKKSKP